MFYVCQKHLWFQVGWHEGESSNGPVEVRGWELTLSASLGLQLRSESYWRAVTAQSTDDCHLLSTMECLSIVERHSRKKLGWCCESQHALNWSRSGWVAHSNHLVAHGCVSMECIVETIRCSDEEGTQEETTFSWDLMGEGSWKFRVKQPAWRLRKENMKLGRRKSV